MVFAMEAQQKRGLAILFHLLKSLCEESCRCTKLAECQASRER